MLRGRTPEDYFQIGKEQIEGGWGTVRHDQELCGLGTVLHGWEIGTSFEHRENFTGLKVERYCRRLKGLQAHDCA